MLKITWGEVLGSVKLGGGFQNHAGDYLGGGGEEGRPSSRTRSPHTLKLNSEWSADGSTYREGGGTLLVVLIFLVFPESATFHVLSH